MANPSWSEIVKGLDERPSAVRENQIIDHIKQGHYAPFRWAAITSSFNGMTARFFVLEDALRLGNETDSVRINVTAEGQQRIANLLGASLPTAKLVEVAYERGIKLVPHPQTPDQTMGYTSRMVAHSRAVDAEVEGRAGLVAPNAGKHWTLSNAIIGNVVQGAPMAENFGWFRRKTRPYQPIQTIGHRHNIHHTDYSQICWLIRNDVEVDGTIIDLEEVMMSPTLAGLAHHEPLRRVTIPIVSETGGESDESDGSRSDEIVQQVPEGAATPPDISTWRTLRLGMRGEDCKAWQSWLLGHGHSLGGYGADGDFGAATHNATIAWQRSKGLTADGVVGRRTKELLRESP